MMEDIELKRQAMAARYVQTQRHTIQVDWIPFMDELAELNGCKPDFSKSEYFRNKFHFSDIHPSMNTVDPAQS